MCKKQTSVSHSSTESEIISLDTGLRLDGLPALELWDLIVSVFGNISHVSDGTGQPVNGKNKSYNKIDVVHDIDLVPSNVQSANREALLYVFEDNEAVIKMIISCVSDRSGKPESDDHKHHKSHNKIDVVKDIDLVPSNVQSANHEAILYVFEDNEAVIKMITTGRSPTMRRVSRTHRVALDWLCDRINLDPKIQQIVDILTKGDFTRD